MQRTASSLLVVLGLVTGCSPRVSNEDVTRDLTRQVIVPGYAAAVPLFTALEDAVAAFCASPSDATLDAARTAWSDARTAWKTTQATWVGPVEKRLSPAFVDYFPIDAERIEKTLARGNALSTDEVRSTLSAQQRGLGTLEHLLFAEDALTALPDPTRCAYATAVAGVATEEVRGVLDDWETAYADHFSGQGLGATQAADAVATLVRIQVFMVRDITEGQLGPAIAADGVEQDTSSVPAGRAHHWTKDLRAQVEGLRDIYVGRGGHAIGDRIAALSEENDQRMRAAYDAVLARLDALSQPLDQAAQAQSPDAQAVYDSLMELRRTLNTEVVSLLGISVGFSDTDGDS